MDNRRSSVPLRLLLLLLKLSVLTGISGNLNELSSSSSSTSSTSSSTSSSSSPTRCSVILNELQLAAEKVPNEFIELTTTCSLPLDLTPYSLVLWIADKNGRMTIKSKARFTTSKMTHRFLVIGHPAAIPIDGQFYSFDELDWHKNEKYYIDKGNKKTNALILYKNIPEHLHQVSNTSLNNDTAQTEKIVDWLFYASVGGNSHEIRNLLIPDYDVGADTGKHFRLMETDNSSVTPETKRSFGFCCDTERVAGRWPLGFKYSLATPGRENDCSNAAYRYALNEGLLTTTKIDRCEVDSLTQALKTSDKGHTKVIPIKTQVRPAATQDSGTARSLGIGLGIGFTVMAGLVLLAAAVQYNRKRRQRARLPFFPADDQF